MGTRHRSRDRDKDKGRDRERDRSRERDRDDRHRRRHSRSRRRTRSRTRTHSRSRSRSYDRSRSRHHRHDSSAKSNGSTIIDTVQETQMNELDGERLMMETLKTIEAVKASNLLKAAKAAEEAEKNMTPEEREREEKRKKRKSRWNGSEHDKTFIPGMPTILPCTLNKDQEQAYLFQLQIEDISRKLRSGDLGIPVNVEERSPSPEPIYSSDGKRLNTREFRVRKRLEEERHTMIIKMQSINPDFKPPIDYKPPIIKVSDKVMIPQEEHPDINFVGLLIGPRGNTLKNMEKDTGAKIIIRGKGSIKEGKVGRKDGQPLPGEDEPLHAYITGTNPESVKKAVEKVKEVIKQGIEVPENQNDLRRMQLRELAQLNGTLREGDGLRCSNCAATDHKTWQCPDKPNVTNTIMCTNCGSAGHIAKDCRVKNVGGKEKTKIDEEYMHLMAELGEATPVIESYKGSSGSGNYHSSNQNVFDTHKGPMKTLHAPGTHNPNNTPGGGWPPMTPSTTNLPPPNQTAPHLMQPTGPWPPSSQAYGQNMGPPLGIGAPWMPPVGIMNGFNGPPKVPPAPKKIPATAPWPPPENSLMPPAPIPPISPLHWQPSHLIPPTPAVPPPPPGLDMNILLAPPPPPPPPPSQ